MTTTDAGRRGASGNAKGILAMMLSMAAFIANDTCVKLINQSVPLGELIALPQWLCDRLAFLFCSRDGCFDIAA